MPSRDAVTEIVEQLRSCLFPAHFGLPELTDQSVDYYVGHTLNGALRALSEQVRRCFALCSVAGGDDDAGNESVFVRRFASELPSILELLEADVRAAFDGDPSAKSLDEVMLCFPGVSAITYHRIAHTLYMLNVPLLARIISEYSHSTTGIDIHPGAQIGRSFFIDHGTGVVIGETTIIGERVRIYQGVTLGAKSFPVDAAGFIVKGAPRHPIIEDDVVIYAGATILGRVTIGQGSSIGGNVWLTRSVPRGSHITQAQVRSESFDNGGGI
ncbi:MAG TPA: serine O-acetyltransferase EpsC [Polyangiaceae bacterium]